MGDAVQIHQLFQNLITNAIKYRGGATPLVDVSVKPHGSDWLFAVKDNGSGFDQENAEKIFVIFKRMVGREDVEGTGIGLAICKKIVERHNGKIWAESALEKGATFFFTLPQRVGEKLEV